MSSLPFSISMYAGLAKADGLLRLEGNSLVLEFEIQDRALGLLKSELKELRIPIFEIEHLELANGFLPAPVDCANRNDARLPANSRLGAWHVRTDLGQRP